MYGFEIRYGGVYKLLRVMESIIFFFFRIAPTIFSYDPLVAMRVMKDSLSHRRSNLNELLPIVRCIPRGNELQHGKLALSLSLSLSLLLEQGLN